MWIIHITKIDRPGLWAWNEARALEDDIVRLTRVEYAAVGTLDLRECVPRDQRGAVEAVHEAEGAEFPVPVAVIQRALIHDAVLVFKVYVVTSFQG